MVSVGPISSGTVPIIPDFKCDFKALTRRNTAYMGLIEPALIIIKLLKIRETVV